MVSGAEKAPKRMFGSKGRYFILTAFFAAFTSLVMLADSFRAYESEVSVLVLPKNEISAASLRNIVENMEHIAGTDVFRSAFFDALSEKTGAFDDLSASARDEAMEGMVSVSAEEKGSVVLIRAVADDADDAKMIGRQAAITLLGSIGQYYNLKEEVDLRVTNGPTVSARIMNPILFAFSGIALGAATASAFFLVLFGLPGIISFFEGRRRIVRGALDTKVFEPEMPASPFLRDTVEADREEAVAVIAERDGTVSGDSKPVVPTVVTHERKSSAPSNLPALSEEEAAFLREFSFEGSLEQEEAAEMKTALAAEGDLSIRPEAVSSEGSVPSSDREPTEEEYKRRLNELLRG